RRRASLNDQPVSAWAALGGGEISLPQTPALRGVPSPKHCAKGRRPGCGKKVEQTSPSTAPNVTVEGMHTVVLIPGDGIGPEVSEAVKYVFRAAEAPVQFEEHLAGESALAAGEKELLPESTLKAIRTHHVALKGPCTTPVGSGFRSVNVALRKTLNLYAAVGPVRSLAGVPTRYENVDLVIIRENTEGLYSGVENLTTDGVVASMIVATRTACHRIAHWAFRYATH